MLTTSSPQPTSVPAAHRAHRAAENAECRAMLDTLSVPEDRSPFGLSRRRFLQAAAAAGGGLALGSMFDPLAAMAAPLAAGQGVVVVVTLAGGNDGLNTIVPVGEGRYHDVRRNLAFAPGEVLPLAQGIGLHPNLPTVHQRFLAGDVAVLDGVGGGPQDLSHFTSMARVMSGLDGGHPSSGWLGRYLDTVGGSNPLAGVAMGSSVPLVAAGNRLRSVALPARQGGVLRAIQGNDVQRRQYLAAASIADGSTGLGPWGDALAAGTAQAVALADRVAPVYAADVPENRLAAEFAVTARLINADVGVRFLSIMQGSYDSHAGQPTQQADLFTELDAALASFWASLDPAHANHTMVLLVSEFGRRVAANDSAGTDHGAAGLALAIGPNVKGGFVGERPSLTRLDSRGNLVPTIDIRAVYATVLRRWLNADPAEILGRDFEDLDFLADPGPTETSTSAPDVDATPPVVIRAQREEIMRLYLAYFGRLPDRQGLEHWVAVRRSGQPLVAVSDAFAASAEFQQRYGSVDDATFVDLVYRNVLGRAPDGEGRDWWTGRLRRGLSRGELMTGFSNSEEFIRASEARLADYDANGAVARLYQAYFRRRADDAGLSHWLGVELGLPEISQAFASSPEFQQRYGSLDDGAFVDLVFANVLDRRPDPEGRTYWVSQLAAGRTRGEVMLGFSESEEFIRLTGTYR